MKTKAKAMANERGVVSLLFALLLPFLLALGALAVDVPHLLMVRAEMQTAVDAAALAGARYFEAGKAPDWELVASQAQAALKNNLVEAQTLTQSTVQVGYWDVSPNQVGLQPLPMKPTSTDVPAIRVMASRSAGQNGGEVGTFFARMIGIDSQPISVSAVAGRASPKTISPGVIFPLAMPQCMFDGYWDATATPPGPRINPLTGRPDTFEISAKQSGIYPPCQFKDVNFPAGSWAANSSSDISSSKLKSMIQTRNPLEISIGSQIWVNPSEIASLFQPVHDCSAAGDKSCQYVLIAVYDNKAATGFNQVKGFACIEILNSLPSPDKYISVQMSNRCDTPSSSELGSGYGVLLTPKLFQ